MLLWAFLMAVFIQIQQLKSQRLVTSIRSLQMHQTLSAFVIDGPDTVFEVNANAIFAVADLFQNYSINNVSGNTQTGISLVQLDVSKSGVDGNLCGSSN
jgi:hypothetical protein